MGLNWHLRNRKSWDQIKGSFASNGGNPDKRKQIERRFCKIIHYCCGNVGRGGGGERKRKKWD